MSDTTKGDNSSLEMKAGDALTTLHDIQVLGDHFAWHADQITPASEGQDESLSVVSSAFRSMAALAAGAAVPLEEVYERVCGEGRHGSQQEAICTCAHRQEGARAD